MEFDILNSEGKVTGKADWPGADQSASVKRSVVHEVITAYLSNQRKGTHATLTRANVNGGGKKPWKQKHTGRARSGTSRSPLWRGGGIIFGPHPRSYNISLPHKKVKAALSQVLSSKALNGDVMVAEKPELDEVKTKKINQWLKKISAPLNSILVLDKNDEKLLLASRNLPEFEIMECRNLHPYHLLNAKKIIITPEAVKCL